MGGGNVLEKALEVKKMNASRQQSEFVINSLKKLIEMEDSPEKKRKLTETLKVKLFKLAKCSPSLLEKSSKTNKSK